MRVRHWAFFAGGVVLLGVFVTYWFLPRPPTKYRLPDGPPKEKNAALAYYAMKQVGITKSYDATYTVIGYPKGDVKPETGVCTDVVVRGLRKLGVDLQVLIHEDMKKNFSAYPHKWKLDKPDTNIDHRRVDNIACFLRRKGKELPLTGRAADYRPGDIVTWSPLGRRPHIGIVSLQPVTKDRFAIVHNFGAGVQIEDGLFVLHPTGHFRYFK